MSEYNVIGIKEYDTNWPKIFEIEKKHILKSVGAYIEAIEHVGSTAVPFLAAKPTIDICIGVSSLELANQQIINPLEQLGYHYLPHLESTIPERRYLQKLNDKGEHLFHIHIVAIDKRLWKEYIGFRNYLMTHPEEMKSYIELKHHLKEKFAHDRNAYTEGKSMFIKDILSKHQREFTVF